LQKVWLKDKLPKKRMWKIQQVMMQKREQHAWKQKHRLKVAVVAVAVVVDLVVPVLVAPADKDAVPLVVAERAVVRVVEEDSLPGNDVRRQIVQMKQSNYLNSDGAGGRFPASGIRLQTS
jgi:hypothetical protein